MKITKEEAVNMFNLIRNSKKYFLEVEASKKPSSEARKGVVAFFTEVTTIFSMADVEEEGE